MALDAYKVKEAAAALDAVDSIDKLITWLCRDAEREAHGWGEALKNKMGGNRMFSISCERLGQIAFAGIVNDLLRERAATVEAHKSVVNFPPAPCTEQAVPDPSN